MGENEMNKNDMQTICLRPHHGICIQNFIGKGYSEEFTTNMKAVISMLESDPDSTVHLISDNDVLCRHCPHNKGQCDSIDKVRNLDKQCLAICNLQSGTDIKWSEFKHTVNTQILMTDAFDNVCGKCEWFDLCKGIIRGKSEEVRGKLG